ncbi:hypothetical protein RI367_005395 [Sorochytrium milnesiophthora]
MLSPLLAILALAALVRAAPAIPVVDELAKVQDLFGSDDLSVNYTIFKDDISPANLLKMHQVLANVNTTELLAAAAGGDPSAPSKRDLFGGSQPIHNLIHKLDAMSAVPPAGHQVWTGPALDFSKAMLPYMAITACANLTQVQSWSCPLCSTASVSGTQVLTIMNDDKVDARGFILAAPQQKSLVVVFRYTDNNINWAEDFVMLMRDLPVPVPSAFQSRDPKVHVGFWLVYDSLRAQLRDGLAAARQQYPDYTVVFSGFSMGAAMATLAVAEFVPAFNLPVANTKLITIGSPRTGNQAFADLIDSFGIEVQRMVHENDIIVHLGPRSFGYQHTSGQKYSIGDVPYVCVGQEDPKCANSRVPFLEYAQHQMYFAGTYEAKCY